MFRKKPAPHFMRGGSRFSDKDVLNITKCSGHLQFVPSRLNVSAARGDQPDEPGLNADNELSSGRVSKRARPSKRPGSLHFVFLNSCNEFGHPTSGGVPPDRA